MSNKMHYSSLFKSFSLAIFLAALLVLIRVPFLDDLLCGEEGQFAFLVASPVTSAELSHSGLPRGLIANIGGLHYFGGFSRTVAPYLILENIVGGVTRQLNIMELDSPDERAVYVHLIFLTLFMLGSVGAIWISASKSCLVILTVFWALTTPLAVGASLQPQLDGSIGVLLLGTAAFIISISNHPLLLITAGLLTGLGKHEWSMAFFGAAIFTIFLIKIIYNKFDKSILYVIIGLGFGVSVSVMASYEDYRDGFVIMRTFFGEESPLRLAIKNIRYLFPTLILVFLCSVLILTSFKEILLEKSPSLMLFLAGSAIFFGFALSGHNPDFPRYFAPALIILIYSFLTFNLLGSKKILTKNICYCFLVIGFLFNSQYLVYAFKNNYSITTCATTKPNLILQRRAYEQVVNRNENRQIPVISSGIWLYNPKAFFIEEAVTKSGGLNILRSVNREKDFVIIQE